MQGAEKTSSRLIKPPSRSIRRNILDSLRRLIYRGFAFRIVVMS
jgi:hypothetical protein